MTTLSLTHNGTTYAAVPGTISGTMLGFHGNHGTLATLAISLPENDSFSTGDYILDQHRPGGGPSVGTAFGMDYILHILRAANTELWENLGGARCSSCLRQMEPSVSVPTAWPAPMARTPSISLSSLRAGTSAGGESNGTVRTHSGYEQEP